MEPKSGAENAADTGSGVGRYELARGGGADQLGRAAGVSRAVHELAAVT